jgi:DNA-binding transcriptional regulator YiaG
MEFAKFAASYTGDECLLWPFGTNSYGYGQVRFNGSQAPAHRVVCELAHGPFPTPEHHAAHDNNGAMCASRSCVNPKHLRWATALENEADKAKHGGIVRGERHGRAKLTERDVQEIRQMKGALSTAELAARYSVSVRTIRNVHSGKKWGWLPRPKPNTAIELEQKLIRERNAA